MNHSIARSGAMSPRLLLLLVGLVIVLLFLISSPVLTRIGLHYDIEGGSALEKIHPAHLLALGTLALLMMSHQRPMDYIDRVFQRHKGTLLFLIAWALLLMQIVLVLHQPFTPIIDTFILPVVMLLLLADLGERDRSTLARLVHILMFANATLGLFELATGFRLNPIMAGDVVIVDDWRSSAFFGHPLSNAVLTGLYLIILSLGGARRLPWLVQLVLFGTNLLAMNAFGGRMAMVSTLLFLTLIFVIKFTGLLHGGRIAKRTYVLTAVVVPLVTAAVVAGYELGLFDQFLERFVNDKGSASARIIMFEIFSDLSWDEILFGPDPEHLQTLLSAYGLKFGIESLFVAFALTYGLIFSAIFFLGLLAFLWDVVRSASSRAVWPLLYFFLVSSTSVSLSAKSTDLAIAVVLVMLLLPPLTQQRSRHAR